MNVSFLYKNAAGRILLKAIMKSRFDRCIVKFLRSPFSHAIISPYAKRNGIPINENDLEKYRSFSDFFVRERENTDIDLDAAHLISPCDGWLSVFPIEEDSSFFIKGSHYKIDDIIQDKALAKNFHKGLCLIFRLCANDYHHYCYIDNGYQGENHHIPGVLHSVQPIALEKFPVYTLNKRCWSLLETENFGKVVQAEIGALVVGGIVNETENARVKKGAEKGHFELAGSTIVLMFEKDKITLSPEISETLKSEEEARVLLGRQIGNKSVNNQEKTK